MQNNQVQNPLSQRSGGTRPPPLSKYYYGPQPSWSAPDRIPTPEGSPVWGVSNAAEIPPSLPSRVSPVSSVHSFPKSRTYSTTSSNSPLSWQPPGLHLPVPQLNQVAHAPYNPSTYGFISKVGQPPVNPPWGHRDSSGSAFDTSRWANPSGGRLDNSGIAIHTYSHQNSVQATRPPLPPRAHHLARDSHNYNQYEPSVNTHGSSPSAPSEYQASQAGEILQPVTYSPISSQVSTNTYQDLSSGKETYMRQDFKSQHAPPPKPPKVPQEPLDEVQRLAEVAVQHNKYPTERTTHRYESPINQDQHHHQNIPEPPERSSDPKSDQTSKSVPLDEEQPHPSLSSEIYQNFTTQQVESNLVSPVATNNLSREQVDYDDIHWSLPSIRDKSKSTATQNLENIPSYLHQQNSSGQPYWLPDASSLQHFPSSVSVSDDPSAPQSGKDSIGEYDIQNQDGWKRELRQEKSFYWHKESRPSSAPSNITTDELGLRNAENNRSRQHSRDLENKSTGNRLASESYNASALGFGNPSDWEHFGDYEAQEVDDTDLYNSSRLRSVSAPPIDSAELSAEKSPTGNQHQPGGSQLSNLPEPTSSPITVLGTPPESTHQSSQDTTVLAETGLNKTLKLTSLAPRIQPSAVQHITIDSSNTTNIVAPQSPQETGSNDPIRLWSQNMPSQISQDSTASPPTLSSGKTSDPILNSGNVANDSTPINNSVSVSTQESSVNEYARVRRSPEPMSLDDKRVSSRSDSIIRSVDSSAVERSPKADVGTVGIMMTDSLLRLQISTQPPQSTNMTIDRTDVGQHGPIVLHNTSNDVVEATFTDKKLNIHDTVADHKSNLTVLTQTAGSRRAYAELKPNTLSLPSDLTENIRRRDAKQNVSDGAPALVEPNHRGSLKETAEEQQNDDSYFEAAASRITNLEQLEVAKSSGAVNKAASKDDPDTHENGKKAPYNAAEFGACTADATLHINDPENYYGNLDAWGRASLIRYLSMLREEAEAKTDKEKLTIFMVFARRETRLRAVLYGLDDEKTPVEDRNPRKHLAKALTKRSQKALPALPPVSEPLQPPILHRTPEEPTISQADINVSDTKVERSDGVGTRSTPESPTDEMQYSLGGRPIVSRGQYNEAKPQKLAVELTLREKVSKVFTQVAGYTNTISSPSSTAPILVSSEVLSSQKPAYVPFKYESLVGPTEYVLNRRSTSRPYASLTSVSPNNKSTVAKIPVGEGLKAAAGTHDEHTQMKNVSKANEDFISSIESTEGEDQTGFSPDLRRFVKADFDPLVAVLSFSETLPVDSLQLQELSVAIDAFPDDFSFIHQSVVAWDTTAKKEREIHERDRHLRQGESERKIDELFDDNEIGYGDISELESEFKNSEAAKKADEDRGEYQTFVLSVFDVVWTRLHYDISQITPLSTKCLQLVNDSLVGKDMFTGLPEQSILAPTMSLLLALHQKLEIRYQKAFEAVLERDRRLKKTEISPWYTLGNVTKVKQLEKQFDSSEKNAIVEFCEQRRDRAKKIMDVLDTNTLRGVGANQDYIDAIMKSIRRVASGRAFASMPSSEAGLGVEEVDKAKRIITILTSSSEQIVQTFHVADKMLNAADYEVSVANAKLGNAGADTFVRLKEEKSKEDQKLMDNLGQRLALIREDSRKTHDEIVKLLLFLGVQNGHGLSPSKAASPAPGVPGNEDLIQKALETAKLRNAVKAPG